MTQDRDGGVKFISCPFCNEDDFDLHGLKWHLNNAHCEPYNELPATGSLFGLVNTRSDPLAGMSDEDWWKLWLAMCATKGDPCPNPPEAIANAARQWLKERAGMSDRRFATAPAQSADQCR